MNKFIKGLKKVLATVISFQLLFSTIPCLTFADDSQDTSSIIITDNTPPVVTRTGPFMTSIYHKLPYEEMGATAFDNIDGDITDKIITIYRSGSGDVLPNGINDIDTSSLGTFYNVVYYAVDSSGNQSSYVQRILQVVPYVDTVKPAITLNGNTDAQIHQDSTYSELGATALDNYDGDITDKITITYKNESGDVLANGIADIDSSVLGTKYQVVYNVSDDAGNPADTIIRNITIVEKPDTTIPVITLNGDSNINIYQDSVYTELGATATDDRDGDISSKIVIEYRDSNNSLLANGLSDIDTTKLGVTYKVIYKVSDLAGNNSTELERIITVVEKPDTVKPSIKINGTFMTSAYKDVAYTEQGATATDDRDGDITDKITVIYRTGSGDLLPNGISDVDTSKLGATYQIVYQVQDLAGNQSQAQRIVTIVDQPDTTKPILNLIGENSIDITVGENYNDPGVSAIDDKDGDIATKVVLTITDANGTAIPAIDMSKAGIYTIKYNVQDASGNIADEIVRTVKVHPSAPIVEIDDIANKIIGVDGSYEYSKDNGNTWNSFYVDEELTFEGEQVVVVRKKATSIVPESNSTFVKFTLDTPKVSSSFNGDKTQATIKLEHDMKDAKILYKESASETWNEYKEPLVIINDTIIYAKAVHESSESKIVSLTITVEKAKKDDSSSSNNSSSSNSSESKKSKDDSNKKDEKEVVKVPEVEVVIIEDEEIPLGSADFNMPYANGYVDKTFRPTNFITRGEVATILARLLGLNVYDPGTQKFSDVSTYHWAYKYIQALANEGLVSGYEDGSFRPDQAITIGEFQAMLMKYKGIVGVTTNEKLLADPEDMITRADAVKYFNKILNRPLYINPNPTYTDIQKEKSDIYGDIEAASASYKK